MKMNKYFKTVIAVLCLLFVYNEALSQWEEGEINVGFSLPPVALVDIEPDVNNSIHFTILPAAESGASPQVKRTTDQKLWLNYSSALANPQNTRSIVAEITGGGLPEGVSLNVEASRHQGMGDGQFGKSAGKVVLGNQPKVIITNVGNCFTGDGESNGHQLTFSIEVSDYSKISAANESSFTILYTLSDN
jgi:hypothetical protein